MDFVKLLNDNGIIINNTQLEQFETYYQFLVEYNENVNLTSITDYDGVYLKHFFDSILLSKSVDLSKIKTLCDVGSGAGFPSIPLKIMYPELDVTIIDSLDKRLVFLSLLIEKLKLDNIHLYHSRAEDYAKKNRECFDLVTARAVARQSIINELCLPLTKVGGVFASMKGPAYKEELAEGKSLEILGGKIAKIDEYTLPEEESFRAVILINHFKKTDLKYPRRFDMIKKNPL